MPAMRRRANAKQSVRQEFLQRLEALNVDRGGGVRKPHKPLLLLVALARLMCHGERTLGFVDVERTVRPLLQLFAPPVVGRPQPELPYWHLRSDEVWRVDGAERMERTAKGFPTLAALRGSSAGIEARFVDLLLADPAFARAAVQALLDEHFEPSLHDDVLTRAGFPADWLAGTASPMRRSTTRLERDPAFRDAVLAAYDHRCAVTGFQAMIDGALFGVEAAHVHWHSKGGPSRVTNGIALNPTMHKLFDYGAWTLTDDRRVLVSSVFSGSDVTIEMLRSQHGKPLRSTVRGEQAVEVAFIRWHREAELGGVFRGPALG